MAVNKKLLQGATAGAGGLTPSEHFGVVLYEGDGAAGHSINGGKFGAAAYFNGSSSKINLPSNIVSSIKSSGSFAVSAWFNTNSTGSRKMIFSSFDSSYMMLEVTTGNQLKGVVSNSVGTNTELTISTTVTDGNWHHALFTGENGNLKLYLDNGTPQTSASWNGTFFNGSGGTNIGSRIANDYFDGKIDQVRVFTKALSSSEVSTLYAETAATVESLDPLSEDTTDTLQVLGDTSCIATYRFENNEDDLSGNYDATGYEVQYAAGRYGQSASFNGSSSYAQVGTSDVFTGTTFSVSIWVIDEASSGYREFFSQQADNNKGIYIGRHTNSGTIRFNDLEITCSLGTTWNHLVFTVNGSTLKTYQNGSLIDTKTNWAYLSSETARNGTGIRIGRQFGTYSEYWLGKIDQLRLFNKTLSAAEVTTLYNENPLIASYRFEGNSNDDMRTYNGTDSNVTYEYGLGFQPDLVWLKQRDGTAWHTWIDSTRGGSKRIVSNSSNAETTDVNRLTSFDTGGFTLGSDGDCNGNGKDFVAWCFKANGGTTSSNSDGSVTSTVQANQNSGFSIVTATAPSSGVFTVGHGLNAEIDLYIIKNRSSSGGWITYVRDLGANKYLELNGTDAAGTSTNFWDNTNPTSSVFTMKAGSVITGTSNFVAYCFKSIDSFSKIGSFTGNNSLNGPIVETGFEPAFVMVKRTDAAGSGWAILDNKRNLTNRRNLVLWPNSDEAEYTAQGGGGIDFLSNGFQVNSTETYLNASGGTYIYMAFAADPDTEAPTVAKSFSTVTYTGTGATNSIDGLGFSPNLVWIKQRNTARGQNWYDSIRGVENVLFSNNTGAASQETAGTTLGSFDTDGFTVGTGNGVNQSGGTYVAWAFKADDNEPTIFGGPAKAVYKFEDNANDVTGTYNGNASNVSYVTGNFNKAASFNGSNSGTSGIVLTDLNDTLAGSSFSISLWVNCSSTQTGDNGEATIIGSAASSGVNGFDIMLKPTTGYLFFNFGNPNNDTVSTTDLRDDTWHHIVFTYTSSQALLYLDGNLLLTENSPNSLSSITNEITLGKWATGNYYALTGKIDQLRIYNGVVSDVGVAELYAESTSQNDDLELGGPPKTIISANSNAGMSIVKYTGTGVNTQILHGLSAAPELIIAKNLQNTTAWGVYVKYNVGSSGNPASERLTLQTSDATTTTTAYWGGTEPTSTVFTVGTENAVNQSGYNTIAYCFHSVSNYSKIGSYVGNAGTQTITTGFQPDFILIKKSSGTGTWRMFDSVRGTDKSLRANDSAAEYDDTQDYITFISTGFSYTNQTNSDLNENNSTYIYMAIKIN